MTVMIGITIVVMYLVLLIEFQKQPVYVGQEHLNLQTGRLAHYNFWLYIFLAISLIFVSGFRYGFVDTPVYRAMFDNVPTELVILKTEGFDLFKEYGFTFFMSGLRHISTNSQILLLVTSTIIIGVELFLLKKYAFDLPFSFLIFFFMEYVDSMNGIRQVMVGMLFLLTIPLIRQRRFLPYCLVILLLCTMHVSAIICLPLYFLVDKRMFHPAMLITIGIVIICYLYPPLINSLVDTLFGSDSKYATYFDEAMTGMSTMRLLVQLAPLALLVFYEVRKRLRGLQNQAEPLKYYQIFANLVILNAAFSLLAIRLVSLARLSIYVSFGNIILVPYLLYRLFNERDYRVLKILVLLAYFFFFVYQLYSYDTGHYLDSIRLIFWEESAI